MSNWRPYDPEFVPTEPEADRCAVCGNPKEPHRYRHVFVSELRAKEATNKVENAIKRMRSTEKRTCKLHSDCTQADEMVRAAGGREVKPEHNHKHGNYSDNCIACHGWLSGYVVMTAKHEN